MRLIDELERILGGEPTVRPEMMPKAVPFYERETSVHPDAIRVSFRDGSSAVYDLRVEQPAPQVIEAVGIIRKWNGYEPRHGRAEE